MSALDYINGEQVKCFYTPTYSDNMYYSNGKCCEFKDGDSVPSKELWYDYTDNFIIIDYIYSGVNPLIHIIKDSKIYKTTNLENLVDSDFIDNNKVIDYYGKELNISSTEDILNFINDKNELDGISDFKSSSRALISKDLLNRSRDLERIKSNTSILLFLVSPIDRDALFEELKGLDIGGFNVERSNVIELIASYKELISESVDILEKIRRVVLTRLEDEYSVVKAEYISSSEADEEVEMLKRDFNKRWFDSRFKEEKTFGEYLECCRYLGVVSELENSFVDYSQYYKKCEKEFREFIKNNPNILDRYLLWSNFDEDIQSSIRDITAKILNIN